MAKIDTNKTIGLFLRYLLIVLLGLGNLVIFYTLFTPITTRTIAIILGLFAKTTTIDNLIFFKTITIELIPACIAGSAYYLLTILSLSVPNLKVSKRFLIIAFSFASLFILNVLRILFLASINKSIYFEAAHLIFWYGVSTIFVVGIWITIVKAFKIREVPIYSDFKYLFSLFE